MKLEAGLIFSEPEAADPKERSVVLAFTDESGWQGAAAVWFSGLNFRCGDGSATAGSLQRDGVEVAPRELWDAITVTLFPEQPTDYFWCDVMEWKPGREVRSAVDGVRPGDDWIGRSLATSPLLRYRWDPSERSSKVDAVLRRMLDADDAQVVQAARSLAPRRQRSVWVRALRRRDRTAADAIADLCGSLVEHPLNHKVQEGPSGREVAAELRKVARSMFGGPLYAPGLWPVSLDRILVALDSRS
ncbi:hypothetical protein GCM10009846_16550 [Agrococcus versicolor]|uniref:DUF3800 domain-containing protein n=1 Tax=Agrococcus versicolor TaxID=501482 RepID=A0ABP5MKW6_9MICO